MRHLAPALVAGLLAASSALAQPAPVLRSDLAVSVKSTAPGMAGAQSRLYVRQVKLAQAPARSRGVVLFVHGAGTPAEVAFDTTHGDFSWMAYLARAGFDVYSMDMTGYGRSARPPPMENPCNLPSALQAPFVPAACPPAWTGPITTMASDWNDIDAVVDHLRAKTGVKQVALVGWSQGGPRTGGYAAAHPDKVSRLVVLAPAYTRDGPTVAPPAAPGAPVLTTQSQAEFVENWRRQAPCAGQFSPETATHVWSELQESDPVGAKWGPGVRRAPAVATAGFNRSVVAKLTVPYLMVAGLTDGQVNPVQVRELYEDLGSRDKVLVELACSSHNAMWESHRLLLFKASLDWLTEGKVQGLSRGVVKLGE